MLISQEVRLGAVVLLKSVQIVRHYFLVQTVYLIFLENKKYLSTNVVNIYQTYIYSWHEVTFISVYQHKKLGIQLLLVPIIVYHVSIQLLSTIKFVLLSYFMHF